MQAHRVYARFYRKIKYYYLRKDAEYAKTFLFVQDKEKMAVQMFGTLNR